MKTKKEEIIISARIWLNTEIGELAGFAHQQFGYEGIIYSIKELKRLAKIVKRDLHNKAYLKEADKFLKKEID